MLAQTFQDFFFYLQHWVYVSLDTDLLKINCWSKWTFQDQIHLEITITSTHYYHVHQKKEQNRNERNGKRDRKERWKKWKRLQKGYLIFENEEKKWRKQGANSMRIRESILATILVTYRYENQFLSLNCAQNVSVAINICGNEFAPLGRKWHDTTWGVFHTKMFVCRVHTSSHTPTHVVTQGNLNQ